MNTPVPHRIVALALAVVVTLGLFDGILRSAAPGQSRQLLVETIERDPARV